MSESEGDKKRNKLGYQRISVACAHCRRRKIRCVMADGDRVRCSNCIRLNKECIFHPVEQQTSNDGASVGQLSSTISHSPRDLAAGQPFDTRPNTYTRLAPLPSNAPRDFTVPYDSTSAHGPPLFDYRTQHYGEGRWLTTDPSVPPQLPVEGAEGSQNMYWSGSTDEFSNLGGAPRQVTPDTRSYSFSGVPPEEQQWNMLQQQGRSMSYGNFQDHSAQPIAQHATFPIDTQSASAMRIVPGPHSAPIGGGGFPQYAFQSLPLHSQQALPGTWFHGQQDFGEFNTEHNDDSTIDSRRTER